MRVQTSEDNTVQELFVIEAETGTLRLARRAVHASLEVGINGRDIPARAVNHNPEAGELYFEPTLMPLDSVEVRYTVASVRG